MADHRNEPSLLEGWLRNKTPESVRAWLEADDTFALVAETDDSMVGVAMMRASGEITLCYLVPEARFKGIGKALLYRLEAEARRLGVAELRLESTKTAHPFYLRNGYSNSGDPDSALGIERYPMRKQLTAGGSAD